MPEETPPDSDATQAASGAADGSSDGTSDGSAGRPVDSSGRPLERRATDRTLPRWVIPAVIVFWIGYLLTYTTRHVFHRLSSLLVLLLVSVFLSLAIEPGVNRLAARGWRRGRATITILLGVLTAFLIFAGAVGTLVGTQVADLLSESDAYITDTVNFLNDNFGSNIDPQDVIEEFNDPDGRVQEFIQSQSDEAVRLSLAVVAVIFQMLSVILFTYYLVADGPRMRRGICSRLNPARQAQVLRAWELAITKTGGYLYSRALLALLSAFFHWIVFQSIGTPAPVALALWVGLVSQFLPVVGTYLAGILPVLLTLLDSPVNALDRDRVHRGVPADRELLLRAAHHGANDGTPPGGRVRRSARRRRAPRVRRCVARAAGCRDDPSPGERVGQSIRRGGQPSHRRARTAVVPIVERPERPTGPRHGRPGRNVTRFDGRVAPIAVATRSGLEESVHHGAGVAIDGDAALRASIGDPDLVVYPRSCLKPMQAAAMVGAGLELDDRQLAVACASHDGSADHLDVVRSILERYDLTESDLANTPARPYGAAARAAARAAGIEPSALQQNCSGKHAAMLATCRVNGWSIADYLDPDHPLQAAITLDIQTHGAVVHHIGTDGCGAPTHALSLRDLAAAFGRLATPGSVVARAMTAHPMLVGGPTRDVTLWMHAVPTLVAKEGAAGVMAAGLADGRAVAFKVADGNDTCRQAVVAESLRAAGVDVDEIATATVDAVSVPVLGHGHPVGRLDALGWTRCSS